MVAERAPLVVKSGWLGGSVGRKRTHTHTQTHARARSIVGMMVVVVPLQNCPMSEVRL